MLISKISSAADWHNEILAISGQTLTYQTGMKWQRMYIDVIYLSTFHLIDRGCEEEQWEEKTARLNKQLP